MKRCQRTIDVIDEAMKIVYSDRRGAQSDKICNESLASAMMRLRQSKTRIEVSIVVPQKKTGKRSYDAEISVS